MDSNELSVKLDEALTKIKDNYSAGRTDDAGKDIRSLAEIIFFSLKDAAGISTSGSDIYVSVINGLSSEGFINGEEKGKLHHLKNIANTFMHCGTIDREGSPEEKEKLEKFRSDFQKCISFCEKQVKWAVNKYTELNDRFNDYDKMYDIPDDPSEPEAFKFLDKYLSEMWQNYKNKSDNAGLNMRDIFETILSLLASVTHVSPDPQEKNDKGEKIALISALEREGWISGNEADNLHHIRTTANLFAHATKIELEDNYSDKEKLKEARDNIMRECVFCEETIKQIKKRVTDIMNGTYTPVPAAQTTNSGVNDFPFGLLHKNNPGHAGNYGGGYNNNYNSGYAGNYGNGYTGNYGGGYAGNYGTGYAGNYDVGAAAGNFAVRTAANDRRPAFLRGFFNYILPFIFCILSTFGVAYFLRNSDFVPTIEKIFTTDDYSGLSVKTHIIACSIMILVFTLFFEATFPAAAGCLFFLLTRSATGSDVCAALTSALVIIMTLRFPYDLKRVFSGIIHGAWILTAEILSSFIVLAHFKTAGQTVDKYIIGTRLIPVILALGAAYVIVTLIINSIVTIKPFELAMENYNIAYSTGFIPFLAVLGADIFLFRKTWVKGLIFTSRNYYDSPVLFWVIHFIIVMIIFYILFVLYYKSAEKN